MARSIFDPNGSGGEHDGSRFTPPDADQMMPERFLNPPPAEVTGDVGFEPPPEKPAIDVSSEEEGKLLIVQLTGKLHQDDYQRFLPIVESRIREHGKVRMLVHMHNFHGWDAGALWEDMKFDAHHFKDIERLAIVVEKTWEKWMTSFCKPFTSAKIQYFSIEQAAEARAWITAA